MAIQVTCENCGAGFRTDDSAAGKQAPCPKCGSTIQIPIPGQAKEIYEAEDADSEEFANDGLNEGDDRRPCPMCGERIVRDAVKCRYCGEVLDSSLRGVLKSSGQLDDNAWSKVRSGLNTIYNCLGITIGTAILLGILSVGLVGLNGGKPPTALMILVGLGMLVILGAAIGMMVGYVRCTNVPTESSARGFALGTLICTVVNILLSIAGNAIGSEALSGIGSLISLIGWILFIFFIKRSAAYLNDSKLESSAGKFLLFGVILFVGLFMLGLLSPVGGDAVLGVLGIGVLVAACVSLFWFLRLIQGLRTTIDLRLGS